MKIWLITDTHFNHNRLIELQGRPVNFKDKIIKNWIYSVQNNDVVIHLGDVMVGKDSELTSILEHLPGKKIVVRGNHDNRLSWLINHGFDFACNAIEMNHIYFTHRPATILPPDCHFNIHGHTHGNGHRDDEYTKQPWHIEFNIEDNLRPVLLEEVLNETDN